MVVHLVKRFSPFAIRPDYFPLSIFCNRHFAISIISANEEWRNKLQRSCLALRFEMTFYFSLLIAKLVSIWHSSRKWREGGEGVRNCTSEIGTFKIDKDDLKSGGSLWPWAWRLLWSQAITFDRDEDHKVMMRNGPFFFSAAAFGSWDEEDREWFKVPKAVEGHPSGPSRERSEGTRTTTPWSLWLCVRVREAEEGCGSEGGGAQSDGRRGPTLTTDCYSWEWVALVVL